MKTKNINLKLLVLFSAICMLSCELNDDENFPDPVYEAPLINIEDGSVLELGVGQFINFPSIQIEGTVGISNFKVSDNNTVLKEENYDGNSGNIQESFQYAIPEEWLDTTRAIVFEATDKLGNLTSVSVTLTVSEIEPQYQIENVVINGQEFKKITGTINFDETLDDSSLWIISGLVFVAQQTTLTITEGTQIYAETFETRLNVNQLGSIDWQGTSTNPIVFNSLANAPGQGPGDDSPGQWGGIDIVGSGGSESSGIIKYVRLMYPGSDDDALQFTNVGNGTTAEYIQVFRNDDNSFRINDGTVSLKYIISTNTNEVGIRWDDDWLGYGQFWVVNTLSLDNAIEGRGGLGFISNVTLTGVGLNNTNEDPNGTGFRIRNGGAGVIYNTVITGFDRSLRFSNGSEATVADGTSFLSNSASFNNGADDGTGFHSTADFFNPTDNDYMPEFNNSVEPFDIINSYVGTSTLNSTPAGALNPFFTDVNYIGAVEVGNDWTLGWCVNMDGSLRE